MSHTSLLRLCMLPSRHTAKGSLGAARLGIQVVQQQRVLRVHGFQPPGYCAARDHSQTTPRCHCQRKWTAHQHASSTQKVQTPEQPPCADATGLPGQRYLGNTAKSTDQCSGQARAQEGQIASSPKQGRHFSTTASFSCPRPFLSRGTDCTLPKKGTSTLFKN